MVQPASRSFATSSTDRRRVPENMRREVAELEHAVTQSNRMTTAIHRENCQLHGTTRLLVTVLQRSLPYEGQMPEPMRQSMEDVLENMNRPRMHAIMEPMLYENGSEEDSEPGPNQFDVALMQILKMMDENPPQPSQAATHEAGEPAPEQDPENEPPSNGETLAITENGESAWTRAKLVWRELLSWNCPDED
eukprot:TRINITY_DN12940_c0_g1_i1.p1 TRINITY_DN12940_c0_g1~~TRINITY_DN12940_c0_g1_i1.p1  ORF type:complete len:192 (+),score=31.03 TRINITY_DN12940_c0_g1_i1:41-616(+)